MSVLLIDGADVSDVSRAVAGGPATEATNPKLMRAVTDRPPEHLGELPRCGMSTAYHRPTGAHGADLLSVRGGRRPEPALTAASVESPEQVVAALTQGADSVSVPAEVLFSLAAPPSSHAAKPECNARYGGPS